MSNIIYQNLNENALHYAEDEVLIAS